ncbi:MAG: serine hydrolase [Chromatiaceae bacterium]|nr:MAG: serine hydrolase [Chromatiaceae bacterium]
MNAAGHGVGLTTDRIPDVPRAPRLTANSGASSPGSDTGLQAVSDTERQGAYSLNRRTFAAGLGLLSGALLLGLPVPADAARRMTLQGQVVAHVRRLRAQGAIARDEETSWSVYDFTGRKKLVSINEEAPRQAASMMKPFVALAFFYTVSGRGSPVRYTSSMRDVMERMIRVSNNPATNEVMEIVSRHNGGNGPRDVELVLRRNAPQIFQQTRIVEYIPANGRTYRNQASARDYSRFLYALYHNQFPYSGELREIMGLPNGNRITRGVPGIPQNTRVIHKTGSTAHLCGDMGIVECVDRRGRPRPYTFVGIIEKATRTDNYPVWIRARGDAIRSVSGVVFAYMRDQHQLV